MLSAGAHPPAFIPGEMRSDLLSENNTPRIIQFTYQEFLYDRFFRKKKVMCMRSAVQSEHCKSLVKMHKRFPEVRSEYVL